MRRVTTRATRGKQSGMKQWEEDVKEEMQADGVNYENRRDRGGRTKCRAEDGRTAESCSSWKQPKKHTLVGRFPPFFQGVNGRCP